MSVSTQQIERLYSGRIGLITENIEALYEEISKLEQERSLLYRTKLKSICSIQSACDHTHYKTIQEMVPDGYYYEKVNIRNYCIKCGVELTCDNSDIYKMIKVEEQWTD